MAPFCFAHKPLSSYRIIAGDQRILAKTNVSLDILYGDHPLAVYVFCGHQHHWAKQRHRCTASHEPVKGFLKKI